MNEPKRNIGKKRITFLKEYAELHNCSLYEALKDNREQELIMGTKAEEFIRLVADSVNYIEASERNISFRAPIKKVEN